MDYPPPITLDLNSIEINGSKYLYSIEKLDEEEGISIKLELEKNKNFYYLYKASKEQIINDIKILFLCQDLNHMIRTIEDVFNKKKVKISQTNKMILEFNRYLNQEQKFEIMLEKHEPADILDDLNDKIYNLEKKCSELMKEIEELKKNNSKENKDDFNEKQIENIKNKIDFKKEIKEILNKEIKEELYKEFEKKMLNNLINSKEEKIKEEIKIKFDKIKEVNERIIKRFKEIEEAKKQLEKDNKIILEKINKISNLDTNNKNLEDLIKVKFEQLKNTKIDYNKIVSDNNFIENLKINLTPSLNEIILNNKIIKQLKADINKVNNNNIINNNNENFIILKINIDRSFEEVFLQQCIIYKYFKNFEPEDIQIIINDETVPTKYKKINANFIYNNQSNNYQGNDNIFPDFKECYHFYWNFLNEGIYTIKIIFKKKLYSCEKMFYNCKKITEIDLSSFDCSQVTNCKDMFNNCISLTKIDFGNNDFLLSSNFEFMFYNCKNLEDLDVSGFNTKNSVSFESMFENCYKVEELDVSKFNSSKCTTIKKMFKDCKNLSSIDLLNWDMSNFGNDNENPIGDLFINCKKLKTIKMSCNFGDKKKLMIKDPFTNNKEFPDIFDRGSKSGKFIWKKGNSCEFLYNMLSGNWEKKEE